ncbi:hypothetical protein JGI3_00829 [Candidatus Kryptobacter tengchongensis]|uniref:CdaR family protein n=1 Tax=Kryptobacter tengchongensis TaxID=1643429 RepID=UPI0007083FAB|nr:CdaR family protein [Candidatus Kryptobacter tengchongensis]CUS86737.1 hypothetical protein JGI20_01063 [Candidatus Kryptobacter tengchongensis]CUU03777.1 hypothetical protein JGI3_00829 [Candidatus Kryptobacter tengchongensis]
MKRYISFIISFAFAFLLWLIVNLNGEYEDSFKARILIKNLRPEKAIKNDYPEFVNIRLKGRGWKILPFYFLSKPHVSIDLSNIHKTLHLNLLNNPRVQISLPKDVNFVGIEPDTLSFELEQRMEKKVPVVLSYELKNENNSFAYPPKIFPDSVVVSGPESMVSKIDSVFTDKILIDKIGQEVNTKVKILNPNQKLIKISSDFAQVKFLVEQIVEREFVVAVHVTGIPADKEVILFPPDIKVVVRGTISKVVPLELDKDTVIKVLVSYHDVLNDKTGLVKPQIILPEYLKLVSFSPEGLEYIIRQK